ncbi:fibronectin type III domain-containing protein [Streptomyces yaizuensis]|uniref:Fibronectin type-III domain-containing protein n=1 Tax=Streptomyces yaizuensis TaxID=2989713 RepID=A0AA86IVF3_9ACTN|nr:fibronectin type III domain-containing protein [Streptomyces sp. YSPA8]BDT39539.1 hypothetical protein SYYSPA8_37105 [Streptomyces sp. YSPA8]
MACYKRRCCGGDDPGPCPDPTRQECRRLYPATTEECVDGGLCPPTDPTKEQCRDLYPISFEESRAAWPVTYPESRDKFPVTAQECRDGHLCDLTDGPLNLDLESTTEGTATLTWDALDGSTEYRLYRSFSAGTATTTTDGCAVAGTTYAYTVTGTVDGAETAPSNEVRWTPPAEPHPEPDQVTNFRAAAEDGVRRVELSWEHTGERLAYFWLERRKSGETQWRTVNRNLGPEARTWTDILALEVGVAYEYRIRAIGHGGESDPVTTTVTIPAGELPAPDLGAKSSSTTTSITMDLGYPDDYRALIAGFVVEMREDEQSPWERLEGPWETDPQTGEITVTGLVADLTYQFRVAPKKQDDTLGPWSAVREYATKAPSLMTPENLVVDNFNQQVADLHWDGNPGASGYTIRLYRGGNLIDSVETTNTFITLPMQPDGTYRAEVTATRGGQESAPATVEWVTAGATPQPTGLTASNVWITGWDIRVRWNDPVADAAYLVTATKDGDSQPTRSRFGCSGSGGISLRNMPAGTYTIRVRTEIDEHRESAWTEKTGHVVPEGPP